jgi:hypothetical protein
LIYCGGTENLPSISWGITTALRSYMSSREIQMYTWNFSRYRSQKLLFSRGHPPHMSHNIQGFALNTYILVVKQTTLTSDTSILQRGSRSEHREVKNHRKISIRIPEEIFAISSV